jgi:hypothetical protein
MHGLLRPSGGGVIWPRPLSQGMVFQRPVMLRSSVAANVAYGLKLRGVPADERRRRTQEMLKRVGLTHLADRQARRLSGGEQQRIALARARALTPEVLFLDEPTASSIRPAAAKSSTSSPKLLPVARKSCSARTISVRRAAWPTKCFFWKTAALSSRRLPRNSFVSHAARQHGLSSQMRRGEPAWRPGKG